jgi:signal peptidase I
VGRAEAIDLSKHRGGESAPAVLAGPTPPAAPSRFRGFRRLIGLAFGTVALGSTILGMRISCSVYQVGSGSMEPTLHCAAGPHCRRLESDWVLINEWAYLLADVGRGDVVAFALPDRVRSACRGKGVRLKRVFGLPGEKIGQRDGNLYVDNRQISNREFVPRHSDFGPFRVPSESYFVIGDNPQTSCDSRQFGAVPKSRLRGKVELAYSPPRSVRRP